MQKEIYLPTVCNQDECLNVLSEIQEGFKNYSEIKFYAKEIERVSTAMIQLILSVGKTCQQQNKRCVIVGPSKEFINAVETMGCNTIFLNLGLLK